MKILKYKKCKDNKYSIEFDNDISIKLYDDVIVKYELLRIKNIDDDLFKEVTSYNDKLEAYYKSLKYITKKIRTEKEIVKYLEKDYDKKTIDETIERLKKDNYINNDLYLKSFIMDQVHLSNNGPLKIKDSLCKLGFREDEVNPYLDKIDEDVWINKIDKLILKKINANHQYGNNRLKEKIVYDIGNMGFYKSIIIDRLDRVEFKDTDVILEKEYNKVLNKLSKKYEGSCLDYQIKIKLMQKGFSSIEIDNLLQTKRTY